MRIPHAPVLLGLVVLCLGVLSPFVLRTLTGQGIAANSFALAYKLREDEDTEHLFAPIDALRKDGTHDVILTDAGTAETMQRWTEDAVIYRMERVHPSLSEEHAERYCLSELFARQSPEAQADAYIGSLATSQNGAAQQEVRDLLVATCREVRADPAVYLRKYGVTHILWNFRRRTHWDLYQYQLPLYIVASNAGDEHGDGGFFGGFTWLLLTIAL